jgi:hypothetical protein
MMLVKMMLVKMMRVFTLFALTACTIGGSSLGVPHYEATRGTAPPGWCHVGPGAFAFPWRPSTAPPLVVSGCERRAPPSPSDSTLAQLVVEPGTSVELEVHVPQQFRDAGCMIHSLVLAHGSVAGDLAIELHTSKVISIITYERTPSARTTRVYEPSVPQPQYQTLSAEVARVGTAIQGELLRIEQSATGEATAIADRQPPPLVMSAVRHPIGQPLPPSDTFTIALRAREDAFSIAVRSTSESRDPPLRFRNGKGAAIATQLVPQAAVVLSHCRVPAAQALASIRR